MALANLGERPTLETVQVYVRDLVTSATWADKELKAYRQVWLEPGTTTTVRVSVPVSACTTVTAQGGQADSM